MHNHVINHTWKLLQKLSYWYFLVCFLLCGFVSVLALRNNNLQMINLRDSVVRADEKAGDINTALNNLRQYVYGHMNTDLTSGDSSIKPPIQLKNTYERLVVKEKQRVGDTNKQVSVEATAICEQRFPAGQLLSGRVQCVQDYITQNSTKEKEIPKELYQFDFVSPVWSPDLAGWSMLISTVLLIMFVIRLSIDIWFKHRLSQ